MSVALEVVDAGSEHAEAVLGVIRRAFSARPALDPPSTASDETVGSIRAALESDGGLLLRRQGRAVGAMLFDRSTPGQLGLRRVSIDPSQQGHGFASAMVGCAEDVAEEHGLDAVWLTAREELPATKQFWGRRGYCEVGRSGTSLRLAKSLWLARELPLATDTEEFGEQLTRLLRPGDLVILSGELGSGKTTLTRGVGRGLGVRGEATSPTFVISRVHPSRTDGPSLVHVDAYRLSDAVELEDLDLDASLANSVTVVEWGEGLADGLSADWLEVQLTRHHGGPHGPAALDVGQEALEAAGPRGRRGRSGPNADDARVVSVRPHGPRWAGVALRSTLLPGA